MPESAELIDDQDKTGALREDKVIAEKLNEFFALIHAHSRSKWEIPMLHRSPGKAHQSICPKLKQSQTTLRNELTKQRVTNQQDWIIIQQF